MKNAGIRSVSKKYFILFKVSFSIIALTYLISHLDLDLLSSRIKTLSMFSFLSLIILLQAINFLSTLRWALVGKLMGINLPYRQYLYMFQVGLFFNQCLPSTIGGDGIRLWYLTKNNTPLSQAFYSIFGDRLIGLFALFLLIVMLFSNSMIHFENPLLQNTLIFLLLIMGVGFTILWFGNWYLVNLNIWPEKWKVKEKLNKLMILFVPSSVAFMVFVTSILLHLLGVFVFYLIAIGFGINLGFLTCMTLILPVYLILVIPISIGGWGLRESALVLAYSSVGVGLTEAMAISTLYGLLNVIVSLPGGILFSFDKYIKIYKNSRVKLIV